MKGPDLPDIHSPVAQALRAWVRKAIAAEQRNLEQSRLDHQDTTLARGRMQALRAIENSVTPTDPPAA